MKTITDIFNNNRPLSWSAISSWNYSREDWAKKYILGEPTPTSREMAFGKKIADSMQTKKPLVPFTLYDTVEKKLNVMLSDIPLVGYIDTYDSKTHNFREFKTSNKLWSRAKSEDHGQLKMYALMLYITYKVRPEDYTIHLDCVETQQNGDFSISLKEPVEISTHEVKLTMKDILTFGAFIKQTYNEMEQFCLAYSDKKSIIE